MTSDLQPLRPRAGGGQWDISRQWVWPGSTPVRKTGEEERARGLPGLCPQLSAQGMESSNPSPHSQWSRQPRVGSSDFARPLRTAQGVTNGKQKPSASNPGVFPKAAAAKTGSWAWQWLQLKAVILCLHASLGDSGWPSAGVGVGMGMEDREHHGPSCRAQSPTTEFDEVESLLSITQTPAPSDTHANPFQNPR